VIADKKSLQTLLEIQELAIQNRKLEQEAKAISGGEEIESLRDAMLALSQQLNQKRSEHEDLLRELKRSEGELELVAKRTALDNQRLNQTAVSRDVAGIQHELETLRNRRMALEEVELELLERVEASNREQHELNLEKDSKEAELEAAKEIAKIRLADLKAIHLKNSQEITSKREDVAVDLIELFDKKFARGLAIGKLTKSTCGACNMNLNATSMSALANLSPDEVASCPECQAILIRA
jgi:uncharacterized protein